MMKPEEFKSDVDFWNACVTATGECVEKLNNSAKSDETVRVLGYFLDRVNASAQVLMTLAAHPPPMDYTNDALTLLRTMYDISLQAMWLVYDPATVSELTEDYRMFAEIERRNLQDNLKGSKTTFAKNMLASPLRSANEAESEKAFKKADARFRGKKGGFPKNWYRHNLRQLAEELGFVEEYDFMLCGFSGSVHGSPANFYYGPNLSRRNVILCAWEAMLRVLGANARYHELDLSPQMAEVLNHAKQNTISRMTAPEEHREAPTNTTAV